ncbi:MAG: hypothetical protein AAFR55_01910 [Pseudomonadota bacterium]
MIFDLLGDIMHLGPTTFWLLTALAATGAFMVRELTGQLGYGLLALPVFWLGATCGHLFLELASLHFGVDPITDAIMGGAFGMSLTLLGAVLIRQTANLFVRD